MTLGTIFFAQPLALLGLFVLPIIFWLLRATPPEPKRVALPSMALLDGLEPEEETPDKTPWWILALRFAAAALAIIGFAQPVIQPPQTVAANSGSVLFIIDDGWTSANAWEDIKKAVISASDTANTAGNDVHVQFTAPTQLPLPLEDSLSNEALRKRMQIAQPLPVLPDFNYALKQLENSSLVPAKVIWFSDGLQHDGYDALASYLGKFPTLEVQSFAPQSSYAITNAATSPSGANITLKRIPKADPLDVRVIAQSMEGLSLASTVARFEPDSNEAIAEFSIPSAILNQVARFRILGSASTGQVWLWDDRSLMPSVGLADPQKSDQPLLEEYYYVRKALTPYAQIMEGDLADMIARSPDAIILGDSSLVENASTDDLKEWVESGGALIRFAGPKLAAADMQVLTPTTLRPATRALGGALGWEKPQPIAPFPSDKAFADIKTPADTVLVRRQVLAQPSPALSTLTWARLEDGTPLVTAKAMGRGIVILFHVTATPEWSDLPYDGAFLNMLRRATSAGNGKHHSTTDSSGALAPLRVLDAFGELNAPSGNVSPVAPDVFMNSRPSQDTPAGLYQGPQGSRALNAGQFAPNAIESWPSNAHVVAASDQQKRQGLEGWFLMGAFGLLLIDLLVALWISGRFRRFSKAALTGLLLAVLLPNSPLDGSTAYAQTNAQKADISSKQKEAALRMRFAYVETSNSSLNLQLEAGLKGLTAELNRRTSVEPAPPHAVRLDVDDLTLYPMIYFAPDRGQTLNPQEITALNSYLRNGGSLVIDTRDAIPGQSMSNRLKDTLSGLDVPPLQPTPTDHVLSRSFYLLDDFPGRIPSGQLWIETNNSATVSQTETDGKTHTTGHGDRVSRIFIGSSDWIGAWAIDDNGRPLNSMDGQETRREMAYRFGINLVMCILTGNYKADQVHIPALLHRLELEKDADIHSDADTQQPDFSLPPAGRPQNLDEFFDTMRRQRDLEESEDLQ